jgi:hypothetical protein
MSVLLLVSGWLAIGLLIAFFLWYTDGDDLTIDGLIMCTAITVVGPICLLVLSLAVLSTKTGPAGNRVLIKRRRKT